MELLDLASHDPEEYEGKFVVWRDCEYLVGPYLGSGAERITHKLINRASGLCLHVLKIWRRPDLGYVPSEIRARLAAGRNSEFDFAKLVPISIEIALPGGRAEMQMYIGSPDDAETEADVLTRKGDTLIDKSAISEASQAYEEALAINPFHTHALVNLAAMCARRQDIGAAYQFASQARQIEPNVPLYHRACIDYLAAQGLARLSLDEFRHAKTCFPNVFDFDDLGARLLLACGHPEASLAYAESCLLDLAEKAELLEMARAAIDSRTKAEPLIEEARSLVRHAEPLRIAELLTEAHTIDPYDPELAVNLGFSLARAGKSGGSIPLLLTGATHGPLGLTKTCYANAAFCAIDQGMLEAAMILLETTMGQLDIELRGREIENLAVDLPGRGVWVEGDGIIEEPLDSAAELVVRSVAERERQAPVPENALRLARFYAKAMGAS
jgi:Flp pilus assembly protein TadD